MESLRRKEHRTDTIEWNKGMKRTIRKYDMAQTLGNLSDSHELSIEILTMMQEKANMNYDIDYIILDEYSDMVQNLENLLAGKEKTKYLKPENVWNNELSDALKTGNIMQIIRLIQAGEQLKYTKSINTIKDNFEYLGKINSIYGRIQKSNMQYEER